MNAELKPEWTAALRSGEYEQGKNALCKNGKYCCLGVLGDVLAKKPEAPAHWENYPTTSNDNYKALRRKLAGSRVNLPDDVQAWVGLTSEQHDDLITLNDVEGATFAEIADYIDANIPTTPTPL